MKATLTTIHNAEGVFHVQKTTWLDVYPNEEYGVKREDIAERFADEKKFIAKTGKRSKTMAKIHAG